MATPPQPMPAQPHPMSAQPAHRLSGEGRIPGDKSVSHRALLLGALAVGETRITGLLSAGDTRATADAVAATGALVHRDAEAVRIFGRGVGGLGEPEDVLDMGNAGTAARLLLGALTGQPVTAFLTGDSSLRGRPMRRVTDHLHRMGAATVTRAGGRLPLAITGTADPLPYEGVLPVASAQVKSAILLAGLAAPGETRVTEPAPTRDHTERLLAAFGAACTTEPVAGQGQTIRLTGQPELTGRAVAVPADVSAAAFVLVAGLIVPDSRVHTPAVGLNPHRTGLLTTLREMGARLTRDGDRDESGEPVGDLTAASSELTGVDVPAARAPAMIDEYPILAAAAACAHGPTTFHGVGELRVKESDRLAALADGLRACGVAVEVGEDWLRIHGAGGRPPGGARVAGHGDHRIAMSFLVLGLACREAVGVDDAGAIATSYPGFAAQLHELGAVVTGGGGGT